MLKKLTKNQESLLDILKRFISEQGKSPTLNELKQELEKNLNRTFSSVNSVVQYLDALREKGYITRSGEQGITLLGEKIDNFASIPLVGTISCGSPILAEENIEAYIPVSRAILSRNQQYFLLRASGSSMNLKGINDGDIVLVRKADTADLGEKVVALLGDDATIKVLGRGEGTVILSPRSTDDSYKPIILEEDFRIQGVVEKVIPTDNI